MDKNLFAVNPPMGWNSWDCYGASVTEEDLIRNADYMAEHLKPYGWEYVVCDIQWSEPTADSTAPIGRAISPGTRNRIFWLSSKYKNPFLRIIPYL